MLKRRTMKRTMCLEISVDPIKSDREQKNKVIFPTISRVVISPNKQTVSRLLASTLPDMDE